ncbi:MAG: lipase maturation factor family protein, partial [Opitutales bacterium]
NAENYIENPFPRFLYGRFLQIIGTGGTRDDFSRVAEVLGPAETMALAQAPPATQQTVLRNYNSLLGSFFGRSQWFAQFLESLLLAEPNVLSLLESAPFGVERPNYLRVTLWEYRFVSPQAKENGFWWERVKLDGFEVVLTAGDLP